MIYRYILFVILMIGASIRAVGVYRGLDYDSQFHPDAPKQVFALKQYLDDKYIWYTDSRFIDGYPLFLSHLDEWLIRMWCSIRHGLDDLSGKSQVLPPESVEQLTYWVMFLRWMYGTLIIAVVWWIMRVMSFSVWYALAAALLVATSPLMSVVSHFATGDIACDLFFSLLLLFLALYAKGEKLIWLALASMASAFATAGKYNAGLSVMCIAGFILSVWFFSGRNIKRLLFVVSIAVSSFFLALVVAIPQLVWVPDKTIKDISEIIIFIKNYGVSEDFLKAPLHQRMVMSLSQNLHPALSAFSWVLMLSAVAGLLIVVFRIRSRILCHTRPDKRDLWLLSVCIFPWFVLFTSLALKKNVHVFYFSWLYPGVLIGLFVFLEKMHRYLVGKTIAVICLVGMVYLNAKTQAHELFFWSRVDTANLSELYLRDKVLHDSRLKKRRHVEDATKIIKEIALEPGNIAHFRNRPTAILSSDGSFWNAIHVAPLPHIGYGQIPDWVLLNGPVMPRYDGILMVKRGQPLKTIVVTDKKYDRLFVGINSGYDPAFVTLNLGDRREKIELGGNDWRMIEVGVEPLKEFYDARVDRSYYYYALSASTTPGKAWIQVMRTEEEAQVFLLFNGDGMVSTYARDAFDQWGELEFYSENIIYMMSNGNERVVEPGALYTLFDEAVALPAGHYTLELDVSSMSEAGELTIGDVDSRASQHIIDEPSIYKLNAGHNIIRHEIFKLRYPFEYQIALSPTQAPIVINRWSLKPNVEAIRKSVANKDAAGYAPPPIQSHQTLPVNLEVGNTLQLNCMKVYNYNENSESLYYSVHANLQDNEIRLREWEYRLHVYNDNKIVHTLARPFRDLTWRDGEIVLLTDNIPRKHLMMPTLIGWEIRNKRTRIQTSASKKTELNLELP